MPRGPEEEAMHSGEEAMHPGEEAMHPGEEAMHPGEEENAIHPDAFPLRVLRLLRGQLRALHPSNLLMWLVPSSPMSRRGSQCGP